MLDKVVRTKEVAIEIERNAFKKMFLQILKENFGGAPNKTSDGLLARTSKNTIRVFYRYKKLEPEEISFIGGYIPDLIVHRKYAVISIEPDSTKNTHLKVSFVDDSRKHILAGWIIALLAYVLVLLFLIIPIGVEEKWSCWSIVFVSLFFLRCMVCFACDLL